MHPPTGLGQGRRRRCPLDLSRALEELALETERPRLIHKAREVRLQQQQQQKDTTRREGREVWPQGRRVRVTSRGLRVAWISMGRGFFLKEMSIARFRRRSL